MEYRYRHHQEEYQPSSKYDSRVMRHHQYYIPSADAAFLAGKVLFRVHRHFFVRESPVFRKMFKSRLTDADSTRRVPDSDPIILEEVTAEDFEWFLWAIYNPRYSQYDTTPENWFRILALANEWVFPQMKALAIRELEKLRPDPVDKIAVYHACDVDERLLIPSYLEVCSREDFLLEEEATILGMSTVLRLFKVREHMWKILLHGPAEEDNMDEVIRSIFKIPREFKAGEEPERPGLSVIREVDESSSEAFSTAPTAVTAQTSNGSPEARSEPEGIYPIPESYNEEPPCSPDFDPSTQYDERHTPDADLMFEVDWSNETADSFEDNQTLAGEESDDPEPLSSVVEQKKSSRDDARTRPESPAMGFEMSTIPFASNAALPTQHSPSIAEEDVLPVPTSPAIVANRGEDLVATNEPSTDSICPEEAVVEPESTLKHDDLYYTPPLLADDGDARNVEVAGHIVAEPGPSTVSAPLANVQNEELHDVLEQKEAWEGKKGSPEVSTVPFPEIKTAENIIPTASMDIAPTCLEVVGQTDGQTSPQGEAPVSTDGSLQDPVSSQPTSSNALLAVSEAPEPCNPSGEPEATRLGESKGDVGLEDYNAEAGGVVVVQPAAEDPVPRDEATTAPAHLDSIDETIAQSSVLNETKADTISSSTTTEKKVDEAPSKLAGVDDAAAALPPPELEAVLSSDPRDDTSTPHQAEEACHAPAQVDPVPEATPHSEHKPDVAVDPSMVVQEPEVELAKSVSVEVPSSSSITSGLVLNIQGNEPAASPDAASESKNPDATVAEATGTVPEPGACEEKSKVRQDSLVTCANHLALDPAPPQPEDKAPAADSSRVAPIVEDQPAQSEPEPFPSNDTNASSQAISPDQVDDKAAPAAEVADAPPANPEEKAADSVKPSLHPLVIPGAEEQPLATRVDPPAAALLDVPATDVGKQDDGAKEKAEEGGKPILPALIIPDTTEKHLTVRMEPPAEPSIAGTGLQGTTTEEQGGSKVENSEVVKGSCRAGEDLEIARVEGSAVAGSDALRAQEQAGRAEAGEVGEGITLIATHATAQPEMLEGARNRSHVETDGSAVARRDEQDVKSLQATHGNPESLPPLSSSANAVPELPKSDLKEEAKDVSLAVDPGLLVAQTLEAAEGRGSTVHSVASPSRAAESKGASQAEPAPDAGAEHGAHGTGEGAKEREKARVQDRPVARERAEATSTPVPDSKDAHGTINEQGTNEAGAALPGETSESKGLVGLEKDSSPNDELSEIDIQIDFRINVDGTSNDGTVGDSLETPVPVIGTLEDPLVVEQTSQT